MEVTSFILSIIAVLVSTTTGIITMILYRKERRLYAEMYKSDNDGHHISRTIIILSTKGASPVYYTSYRILGLKNDGRVFDANPENDPQPGVIKNSEPKKLTLPYDRDLAFEVNGKPIEYKIELMLTGNKSTKTIPIFKREWSEVDNNEHDQVDWIFDNEE